jgi:hypothetical protein
MQPLDCSGEQFDLIPGSFHRGPQRDNILEAISDVGVGRLDALRKGYSKSSSSPFRTKDKGAGIERIS